MIIHASKTAMERRLVGVLQLPGSICTAAKESAVKKSCLGCPGVAITRSLQIVIVIVCKGDESQREENDMGKIEECCCTLKLNSTSTKNPSLSSSINTFR